MILQRNSFRIVLFSATKHHYIVAGASFSFILQQLEVSTMMMMSRRGWKGSVAVVGALLLLLLLVLRLGLLKTKFSFSLLPYEAAQEARDDDVSNHRIFLSRKAFNGDESKANAGNDDDTGNIDRDDDTDRDDNFDRDDTGNSDRNDDTDNIDNDNQNDVGGDSPSSVFRQAESLQRKEQVLAGLGVLFTRSPTGWSQEKCAVGRRFRPVRLPSRFGALTLYVYDSAWQDPSATKRALKGEIFEKEDITRFLLLSDPLPLLDFGANVGLVTLQAALQGRQVFAVEAVPENALRLCRSALDFGHAHCVHVIHNAVSSSEGNITLATSSRSSTLYEVSKNGSRCVESYAILADRLLDIVPFNRVAIKIDVESHEGHVIAGAERLFQELDIPLVWMEWGHVKGLRQFGGRMIVDFMRRHGLRAHDLTTLKRLDTKHFLDWPFSVLWKK